VKSEVPYLGTAHSQSQRKSPGNGKCRILNKPVGIASSNLQEITAVLLQRENFLESVTESKAHQTQ
jgi:hypothetical protein